jgi:hypothetical protein
MKKYEGKDYLFIQNMKQFFKALRIVEEKFYMKIRSSNTDEALMASVR